MNGCRAQAIAPVSCRRGSGRLAARRAADAYRVALAGLSGDGPGPSLSEWLLPLAARALAESAQAARDRGPSDSEILQQVARLEARYPLVRASSWDPEPSPQMPTLASW